ncbi:MAG TPA: TetR/AcrR family transcriptional regulator [Acidimicrobiales bacterium]|jgi:AcrR family transcriptional regulator|nr:TetR/AcrR family transcriptional regulator [Acidimicrobiales bacterium]
MPERTNQNLARGAATREHLIEVGTTLFAERGYEDTSIETVLQVASVSRGSLYHHFKNKEALFEAVLEAIENDTGLRVVEAAAGATDPKEILRLGALAWVQLAGDPVVQRVLLIDAPAVLGWERWRALEERHALGLIKGVLAAIAEQGELEPGLVDVFSHVILAAINEIALLIARSDQPDRERQLGADAIDEVLSRLLGASGASP